MSGSSNSGWNIVNAIAVIVVALIGMALLFAALVPRRGGHGPGARHMKNTTQLRGITQGLITYAAGNKGRMPGVDSKGFVLPDTDKHTGLSGNGITVEARFWIMLDNNSVTGDYVISPVETKIVWTTGAVTSANYSFSLLELEGEVGKELEPGRGEEWRDSINADAVLISDRNTGSNAHSAVQSIHVASPGRWEGSMARGDGSANFETTHLQDTQYGKTGPVHMDDNIFEAVGADDAYMIYEGD